MKHWSSKSETVHAGPGRVRHDSRMQIWAAALAMALFVGPLIDVRAHLRGIPDLADEGSQAAEQLLQRAANALGGAERLRAIDRLDITAVERRSGNRESAQGRRFKLWLPDRFQSHVEGIVTHTWNSGRLSFDRDVSPEVQRNAEQSIPAMFRRVSLVFLLRAQGLGAPRLHGEATIADLTGSLVEFTAADGRTLKLLLAPTSAQPLALVYAVRAMGSEQPLPDMIWRLDDYRVVEGVRFPFRLEIVNSGYATTTEVQQIKVNPQFTAADFPK